MLKFQSFYRYSEWSKLVSSWEEAHSNLVKVRSLTRTSEGREVTLLEITDFETGDADLKPAYYIQGGVHAIEGAGVTASLHVAYSLLTNIDNHDLLKRMVFYIVPCADPDGTEMALVTQADIRSRFKAPTRKNELVPTDVNGDGYILQMRWIDPLGPFKVHPADHRLMIRRQAGDEQGPFYQVYQEGVISHYDGSSPIRQPKRVDFNRSYPVGWEPGAGFIDYPFVVPEMRAIADFTLAHPNIFAGVDFHCGTHAILRTNALPDHAFPPEDWRRIVEVGKLAEQITGFPLTSTADYALDAQKNVKLPGNSNDWAYSKLGISHYIVEVGFGYTSLGLTPAEILESDDRKREEYVLRLLRLHDERGSRMHQDWQPCMHPQLGSIEVGGLMVGNARYMYPPDMADVVPKTTRFVLEHAAMRPILKIENIRVHYLGDQIYRIRAAVGNIGAFPTDIMAGGDQEQKRPVTVKLSGDIEVLSWVELYEFNSLTPLGGSATVEWFVKKNLESSVNIEAYHPKAGLVQIKVELS
jgi:hypothetical protein